MYQVLFAEDELLVRLGLQNSIDWKAYDMELAAQADNGLQAYELFQKVRPDVVITDIRMEGMDGCELIEKIRQQDKECAIIVISCLDDFEILRRMIPYKIIGYILKASMTMDEVNEVLKKSTEYLKKIGREGKKTDTEPGKRAGKVSSGWFSENRDSRSEKNRKSAGLFFKGRGSGKNKWACHGICL